MIYPSSGPNFLVYGSKEWNPLLRKKCPYSDVINEEEVSEKKEKAIQLLESFIGMRCINDHAMITKIQIT